MSTLIISLPAAPAQPGPSLAYAYTLTADGHTALQHGTAAAPLLPAPARPGGEVVAVVPVQALSWQRVQLPAGVGLAGLSGALPAGMGSAAARLRKVLEGLLEDRLLDEPAQLHFAVAPDAAAAARAGAPLWVAVCERAWLRAHLQALEAAGRAVARVVPEFAPGATASGAAEVHMLGTPEDPWLVICGHGAEQSVLALPLSPETWHQWAMPALGGAPGGAVAVDGGAPVLAEPAVAALAEKLLGAPVTLHTASARALAAARGRWDLAQFDLASTAHTRLVRKLGGAANALWHAPQWRAARWGAGVLAAAQLLGLNAWAWQERHALAAKEAAVRAALTASFPQVKVVVDAPAQMERELELLRQRAGAVSARDFEPMLAAVAAALPPGQLPTAIEYSLGELHLRGLAPGADEQTALRTRLAAAGYDCRLEDGALIVRAAKTP
ncbi:MAG: type II secretion system protein GspL [Pseudomonadota bacterium]